MALERNPYPGKFILLAGVDGSGKDTQGRRLELVLRTQFNSVRVLKPFPKEPTQGPIGARIYDILFGRDPEFKLGPSGNLSDFEFQKFYIRDRIDHFQHLIIPALKAGTNIICNRGIDSTIVYGANTIHGFKKIMEMHEEMFKEAGVSLIWPDLIVIYDVTPETALKRMEKKTKDAFENELKVRRVTSNYRLLAALYPNCKIVDAEHEGEEGEKIIFAEARQHIYPVLGVEV